MVDEPETPPVPRGSDNSLVPADSAQFVARAGCGRRVLRPLGRIMSP